MTRFSKLEVVQLALLAAMFAVSAAVWTRVPERLPVHWNLAGEVDRYGSRFEGLLVMPLVALGLYAMFLVLPKIDPRGAHYVTFARPYEIIRVATIAFCAALHGLLVAVALGYRVDIGLLVPALVGVLFCVLGSLMARVKSNWFVGVRTPWTLSSAESWTKSNRLGGWMLTATGGALFLLAFVRNAWTLGLVLTLIAAMVIVLPAYSYVVWRRDSQRANTKG